MIQLNPYAKYQEQNTLTASPGELTLMLFDGCIKFLRRAALFLNEKKMENAHNELIRAQDILAELQSSLDMQYELSQGLFDIYEYIRTSAVEINVSKDAEGIPGLVGLLTELRETWQEAVRINRRGVMLEQEAQ
jgi:flagellar protein FliS